METNNSIQTLIKEINWLKDVINQVIASYLVQEGHEKQWEDIPLPDVTIVDNAFANAVNDWNLNMYERLALALAMAPQIMPEALDIFFGRNQIYDRGFTEFGGQIDPEHSGFLPTGQTLAFLITANNPDNRYELLKVIGKEGILMKEHVLQLSQTQPHIPNVNGVLSLNSEWMHYFLTGERFQIDNGLQMLGQKITTDMNWSDAVLSDITMRSVQEIQSWLTYNETLMEDWGLGKILKPGYRALFYGPPGTGKTLTASLLGKATGRTVYKIDLALIGSKYIGETEKNLAHIFDSAQHKDWILYFDEADALFGKRTATNTSNDRHANQQIAYLLQRIEDFPGVVIIASNLRSNFDDAFSRRFQAMIHFAMPDANQRFQLWQNAFSGKCRLSSDIDVMKVSEDYELTGGAIINVLRYCAISAIRRNSEEVTRQELLQGIKNEFKKENKTISNL
jgi:AAA+ superfamily predicted ATPase